jgi:hypothetical protein
MKNLVSFIFAAFAALVFVGCYNEAEEFEGGSQAQVSSVALYF